MKNHCLNVWKGIAAFAVVLIHCTLPGVPGEIIKGIARFAVPLFFLISGYFAYGREDAVLKRRESHIFRLYVGAVAVYYLWAAIRYFLSQRTFAQMGAELFPDGGRTVSDLLLFNRTAMAPHLWFMGALVYCYLFYRLLARKRLEERVYLLIPVLLAANLLLGEGRGLTGIAVPVRWIRSFWLTGFPFFLWGSWFACREKQGELRLHRGAGMALVAAGMLLSSVECLWSGYDELYVGSILTAEGLFRLALAFPDLGKGSLLARIGERDSANIYLWHMLLRNFAALAFLMAGFYETMACQLLMPFLVGAASTALAELMHRIKKKGV
ncbi:acyltransferase [Candidatus Merdisoma sp. HCP28S3_D10]|uniref:acyltransferase n=1 Tax=unclassified Candidatus Merdisoma TaxID=3099611 RepID=UPI003F8BFF28